MAMTQQEVIKNFVYSLVTTKKLGTYAVDEAVRYATKFDGLSDSRTQFLNDIQRVNDSNTFLKDYAGIILDNADTGAITGSDAANGLVKTGKSVIKEKNPVSTWQLPTAGTTITLNDGITNLVYPSTGADGQNFTDAEKFIMRGLKEWVEAGLSANKEAYNLALIGTSCNKIIFQFARGDIGNAQTLTTKLDSKGYPTEITIKINMDKFSYITLEDEDGFTKKPGYVVTYLSRTLAHELNHLLIKANITQAQWNNLPAYVAEGLADLLHGIDDYRTSIPTMGGNADYMEKLLADSRTNKYIEFSNVTDPDYSGGYIFLRYLAKQSATTYTKNFVGTEDAEHYQTSNDFVTISSAGGNDTIESDGNKNSLNGGAGDDSIIIGGEENTVESGQDNDEISLTSASKNTLILYRVGDGNDTIYNSKSTDTLSIDGGAAYTETTINGTTFLGVGDASIALTGERPEIIQSNVEGAAITLNNSVSNTLITGSDDADSIVNTGFSVTINGGSGNNTIKNGSYENGAVFNGGNSVSISAGDGDNYIYGKEDQFVTVVAGNGNDSAHSYMGEKNSINLAGGNNYFNGYSKEK